MPKADPAVHADRKQRVRNAVTKHKTFAARAVAAFAAMAENVKEDPPQDEAELHQMIGEFLADSGELFTLVRTGK